MADFTEVTSFSFFDRLKEAIKGVLFGLLLFIVSVPLLFWNEGRAVKRAQDLEEGAGAVVAASSDKVDKANEGKLVHMTGDVKVEGAVVDKDFGVSVEAVKLVRKVEMYQWKEIKKTKKKGKKKKTKYKYEKTWSDSVIASKNFKDDSRKNPKSMPYKSKTFTIKKATFGAFDLSGDVLDGMTWSENHSVKDGDAKELPKKYEVASGKIYKGKDPDDPKVGDVRVTYEVVPAETVSLIAKQSGSTFASFTTSNGNGLLEVRRGTHSSDAMFKMAHQDNKVITWVLRVVGWFIMFLGIALVLGPFKTIFEAVPLLGNMLGAAVSLFAAVTSAGLSLSVAAVAWLFYRPLIGVPLCLGGMLFLGGTVFLIAKAIGGRKAAKAEAA